MKKVGHSVGNTDARNLIILCMEKLILQDKIFSSYIYQEFPDT